MKNRIGFVSNSSSSSFIVAVKPGKTKCQITLEVDFEKYVGKYGRNISTKEELDELNEREWDGDIGKDIYNECLAAINEGKVILWGSFSDQSGDPVEEMLCNSGLRGLECPDVTVIESEGGY